MKRIALKLTLKASVLSLSFAALVGVVTNVWPSDSHESSVVPVGKLKEIYLECDHLASTTIVDSGMAATCSMVHEELLKRGFGNNFEQLLQWWRSARNKCTQSARCETS